MSGNFIHRHHVEHRVKHYSPREESFPIPLKCIGIDDYWNIDGSRDLSDSWTGFTQFTLLEISRRIYVVRVKTDKTAVNIQAISFMARTLDEIGKKSFAEGEGKMVQ